MCSQFIYPAAYQPGWIMAAAGFPRFFLKHDVDQIPSSPRSPKRKRRKEKRERERTKENTKEKGYILTGGPAPREAGWKDGDLAVKSLRLA